MDGFLPQNAKLIPGLAPATMAGAADADWVSLKGYHKMGAFVYITQGAANTTAITVDKASDVAATNLSAGITIAN